MGQIQSSVNQTVGAASLMAGLYANSPAGKTRQELKTLKKQEERVQDAQTHITADVTEGAIKGKIDKRNAPLLDEAIKQRREIAKRQFELQPTERNYNKYKRAIGMQSPSELAAQRAQQSMTDSQEEKRKRVPIYGAHGEVLNG